MSELINNARKRKDLLKHMILQLHEGQAPEHVKAQLIRLMGEVPYGDIVEVEQELINEGLPQEEVLKLCDIHTAALEGNIDLTGAKTSTPGHPVHTFLQENKALEWEVSSLEKLYTTIEKTDDAEDVTGQYKKIHAHFNALLDVEKHYQKKENLLFPFLEKHDITGPPTVMWGKHDETREYLKGALESLEAVKEITAGEAKTVIGFVLRLASKSVVDMIYKEEEILFPMCLDTLSETEWYEIYQQTNEIGYCLYDPEESWQPEGMDDQLAKTVEGEKIKLPSGSFSVTELLSMLNTIPFDITFVDKDDTVKYFSQGRERIFARNRAILGRKVQRCHPPSSVHIVEKILEDFHAGREDHSRFWITMGGKFIIIEYYAMRDEKNEYMGCLEVSQDLTEKRKLTGEQRLLTYIEGSNNV